MTSAGICKTIFLGDLCLSGGAAAALARYSTEPKRTLDAYVYTGESCLALFQAISSVKIFDDFVAVLKPKHTDLSTCLCLRCDNRNIFMLRRGETHNKLELTARNLCLYLRFLFQARAGWLNFLKLQHRKEKKIWTWLNVSSRCSKSFISIALYLTQSPSASISFPIVISFWLVGIQFSSSLCFFCVSDDSFHYCNGHPFWDYMLDICICPQNTCWTVLLLTYI